MDAEALITGDQSVSANSDRFRRTRRTLADGRTTDRLTHEHGQWDRRHAARPGRFLALCKHRAWWTVHRVAALPP